jgi:hypothetical protein
MVEIGASVGPGGSRRAYHCDNCDRDTVIDDPTDGYERPTLTPIGNVYDLLGVELPTTEGPL